MSANVNYNEWKKRLLDAWNAGASIRFILCRSNTNAHAVNDGIVFVNNVTLDEAGTRVTAGSVTTAKDDANDRATLSCATISFTNLSASPREYVGILAYDHKTTDADSPVIAYFHFTNGPLSEQATQIDIPIPAGGLLYIG